MIQKRKLNAISTAELLYWDKWCVELRDAILLARAEGKQVTADKRIDYVPAGFNGNSVGVPSGLTVYSVIL